MDLVEFLTARLDEDEAIARAAGAELGAAWRYDAEGGWVRGSREDDGLATGHQDFLDLEYGQHIARHDPARVLAEVDAKRQVVEASAMSCPVACEQDREHSFAGSCALRALGPVREVHGQRVVRSDAGCYVPAPPVTPVWTLRLLALPYADHADFDEAWRP